MERFRGLSYGPSIKKQNFEQNQKQKNNIRRGKLNFCIGRSISNIKAHQKIVSIKKKCLQVYQRQQMTPPKIRKYNSEIDQEFDMYANQDQTQPDNAEIQFKQHNGSFLLKSKFKGRAPTILFSYPKCCQIDNLIIENLQKRTVPVPQIQLKYKIYGSAYKCIINAFQSNGYSEGKGTDWDIYFDVRGSKVRRIYNSMTQYQRFNHFAGCWHIGRKDQLSRCLQKQKKLYPQEYNFFPRTYIFPYDFERFQTARQFSDDSQLWIQKPVASSLGRNIRVLSNEATVKKRRNILISQYISNPHLINNFKYDLRIYVVVTSYNPLKIYIFQNGLARFATQTYSKKHLGRKYVHLTNFSINKKNKNYIKNKGAIQNPQQQTSKWSLTRLFEYYQKNGISSQNIKDQIQDIVIKTCIAAEGNMVSPKYRFEDKRNCGFEIYGFDILIDDKFKAWLLEVNVCPSLCSSSPFDRKIKHTLLVDLLNLIGVKPPFERKDMPSPKKTEMKRYRFKNIHSITQLTADNCLQILQPEDWLVLFQSEQQIDRSGHFKRVFPLKNNINIYKNLFQCQRYNNYVLWKHMLSPKGFLSRLNI